MRPFAFSQINAFRAIAGRIFGIDARSLALFRVALALVLMSDLWLRIANLNAFYTDTGVLPRAAQIEIYAGLPALFSLHLMSGTLGGQGVLLAIQVAAALAWNSSHAPAQRVKTLDLVYMQQETIEGFRKAKAKKIVLWNAEY